MEFYIETERLVLRELRPNDDKAFFEMDADPEVHRYLGNKPITTIEEARNAIDFIRRQYIDNGIGRWAVVEKSSGVFIGWSGLEFITRIHADPVNFYDVGYRLNRKYWGMGYATESAKAALAYGFQTMQLQEVIGSCHVENKASRNALEKCGLKFVEKFIYENEIPCDKLKITREDWEIANANR